jgi:hypothetical protein
MVYLSTLQAAHIIQQQTARKVTNDESGRIWKEEVLSYNGEFFSIPLQILRKTMKILYQVKWYSDRNPNQTLLGYKTEMLLPHPISSVLLTDR